MLSADTSTTLLEALAPPAGFTLDAAVGTSYTLDLNAMLAVPTAFALRTTGTRTDENGATTPLGLLEALRTHAHRITLFSDAARIGVPRSTGGGVFGLLERSVVPVLAPRGGAFHPKLWVLRFLDDDGAHHHRVLLSSRNLTFDRSWDTLIRLDQAPEGDAGSPLPALGDFLDDMLALATTPAADAHTQRVKGLRDSLSDARFEVPAPFDAMRLHVLGVVGPEHEVWPFPDASRRTLVVSPFLHSHALDRLRGAGGPLTVVSRGDELDRAFAGTAVADRPDCYEISPHLVDTADDDALTDLHAKVFVVDVAGSRTHVLAGSANATRAAFRRNTEVLLEMTGPTSQVGVRRWLDDRNPSLHGMLLPHVWGEPTEDATAAERAVDELRCALAQLQIRCEVTADGDGMFDARYRSAQPLPDPGDAVVRVRPVDGPEWTPVRSDLDLTVRTPLSGLTALLAVQVELGDAVAELVLLAALVGAPEDREDRLLAHLIANPDRLVRYLVMLLADHAEDRFDGTAQALGRSLSRSGGDLSTIPLLELLLRAHARDPRRLDAVGRLMKVVRRSDELRDDALIALWDSVRELTSDPATAGAIQRSDR